MCETFSQSSRTPADKKEGRGFTNADGEDVVEGTVELSLVDVEIVP